MYYLANDVFMNQGISDNASFADFFFPGFKLRLYENNQTSINLSYGFNRRNDF